MDSIHLAKQKYTRERRPVGGEWRGLAWNMRFCGSSARDRLHSGLDDYAAGR